MDKKKSDLEYQKCIEAFSIVTSLAISTVMDFILAYFGGNWLDNYFGTTAEHTCRLGCFGLAFLAMCMSYYELVSIHWRHEQRNTEKHEKKL